jgi:Phage terminase large subunit
MQNASTPTITQFDPTIIPYQYKVICDVRKNFDYSLGAHEVLLSGSVGSAKSILVAHIAITHCIANPGARFLIGRRSMPALRATLFNKILEHIGDDLKENRDYFVNQTTATVKFSNGSEIISRSWADRKFFKVRSLELSGAAIEESAENGEDDFYHEIKMRVGRLPHIKENIIIHATNPDAPSHWLYKYFIVSDSKTRHVYYSVTTDNPFLPPQYIAQLKAELDPKMARRMIYGEWLEIAGEVVYYAYDRSRNFINKSYTVNPQLPIICTWDFNLSDGKPISMVLMQNVNGEFHIFDEIIITGGRTADTLEEFENKPYFSKSNKYIICGDASGKHRDTRSIRSDYDIIVQWFKNHELKYEYSVPLANPPVRTRHNLVNGYCLNSNGDVRIFVYKDCPIVDEGFRLTKIKKGAHYMEDDSKHYQHCLTAIGYALVFMDKLKSWAPNKTQQL